MLLFQTTSTSGMHQRFDLVSIHPRRLLLLMSGVLRLRTSHMIICTHEFMLVLWILQELPTWANVPKGKSKADQIAETRPRAAYELYRPQTISIEYCKSCRCEKGAPVKKRKGNSKKGAPVKKWRVNQYHEWRGEEKGKSHLSYLVRQWGDLLYRQEN